MFVKIDGSYINLDLVHSIDVYDDDTATLWFTGVDGLCRDVTADDLKVIEGAIRHECAFEEIEQPSPCLEVDQQITELKEKHKTEVKELLCLIRDKENNFNRAFDSKEKEIRHHKYKRCLAMVRCCMADNHALRQVTLNEITNHLQWLFNENFFVKWAARWSKIADKFNDKEG